MRRTHGGGAAPSGYFRRDGIDDVGALDPDTVAVDGTTYTVAELSSSASVLRLWFVAGAEDYSKLDGLLLIVGGEEYPLGSTNNNS